MDEMALLVVLAPSSSVGSPVSRPTDYTRPSPCEQWTVRGLVSHVVAESIMSVRLLRGADAEETVFGLDGDILGADASTGPQCWWRRDP